jgi:hypothetical protein
MTDALNPTMYTPVKPGVSAFRKNVKSLMMPAQSPARKKAILTIARKNNIPRADAQFRQAVAISRTLARKPSND